MHLPSLGSQILIVLSWDPEYSRLVPPHLIHETDEACPESVISQRCKAVFQIRTVPSFDADAKRGESPGETKCAGSQAKEETNLEWPERVPICEPDFPSQRRTLPSIDPVATTSPNGEYETHNTQFEWPLKVVLMVWVLQSQSRAVESPAPVTK
ncbi:hypothetical protein OGAPHI_006703 [Ogataea philodendri]|uniref:Uncharacterized protein n=1 Tax=Ogataea philodendri TaxID=1378263 RepID=A0A9P8T150_9ASCO|nr:uncharacterized protein OGAPHI_006703 [Ogataea philodendri]KAH3661296.1 hypothetical protein OGAPHI_006703 [Ogataea philodendri]